MQLETATLVQDCDCRVHRGVNLWKRRIPVLDQAQQTPLPEGQSSTKKSPGTLGLRGAPDLKLLNGFLGT